MGGKRSNKTKKSSTTRERTLTPVQKRFKEREAAGLDGLTGMRKVTTTERKEGKTQLTQYRESQKQRIQDAARERNEAFQANKKLRAQGGTSAQVAKDNQMYGNTFPSGSIGISPEGRNLAAANIRKFNDANPQLAAYYGGAKAENLRRIKADLKEMDRRDPTKGGEGWKGFRFSDKVVNTFNDAGTLLAGDYTSPNVTGYGLRPDGVTGAYKTGDVVNTGGLSGKDFIFTGRSWERLKAEDTTGSDLTGMTASTDLRGLGITPPKASDYDPGSTAFAIATGNYDPAAYDSFKKSGLNLSDYTNKQTEGSRTGRTIVDTLTGNVGFGKQLGDSWNAANQIAKDWTGKTITQSALGGLDWATRNKYDFDNLGRPDTEEQKKSDKKSNFDIGAIVRNIPNALKDLQTEGKNVSLQDIAATSNVGKQIKDWSQVDLQEAFKNRYDPEKVKEANKKKLSGFADIVGGIDTDESGRIIKTLNTLDNTNFAKNYLSNINPNLQQNLRDTGTFWNNVYNQLGDDEKKNRKVISDVYMGNDPGMDFTKRLLFQQQQNPNLSLKSQLNYASDPNFKQYTGKDALGRKKFENKVKGLNRSEQGLFGSIANAMLSNMSKRIATPNVPGTSNALDLAANIVNTGRDPASSTYADSQRFLRTIGAGGKVTPGTLFRGLTGGGGNTARPNLSIGGGSGSTPVEELLINQQLPTTEQLQTGVGTDAGNLQSLQQQAYLRALASYGFNPNYFAQVRPRFNTSPRSFSDYFKVRRTT